MNIFIWCIGDMLKLYKMYHCTYVDVFMPIHKTAFLLIECCCEWSSCSCVLSGTTRLCWWQFRHSSEEQINHTLPLSNRTIQFLSSSSCQMYIALRSAFLSWHTRSLIFTYSHLVCWIWNISTLFPGISPHVMQRHARLHFIAWGWTSPPPTSRTKYRDRNRGLQPW